MSLHRDQDGPSRVRLYRRRREDSKLFGVCGGIADYIGINAGLVRVAFIVGLFFLTVPTLVTYFFLAWLLDRAPEQLFRSDDEQRFWQAVRTQPRQTMGTLRHKFRALDLRLQSLEAHVTSPEFKFDRELRGARRRS